MNEGKKERERERLDGSEERGWREKEREGELVRRQPEHRYPSK